MKQRTLYKYYTTATLSSKHTFAANLERPMEGRMQITECFRCPTRGVQRRWGSLPGNLLSSPEKHESGEKTHIRHQAVRERH